jgi:peptidoglycan-N-acetylglucosamine deacetylase
MPGPTGKGVTARLGRRGLPVYCGGHRGHAVALTFDDGPGPYTHLVLRLLRRDHARATFFLVGRLVGDWPTLPVRELALGSLGDHTWSHVNLAALPTPAVTSQLEDTRGAILADAHVRVGLFRPPYGSRNAAVDRVARRLGMLDVLWNVDSFDWAGANWSEIARNVLHHVSPGAIVLMHENRGQTIRALKFVVLPALRRLRYRLVTVPQLLALDPPSAAQLDRGLNGCSRNSPRPGLRKNAIDRIRPQKERLFALDLPS